MSKESFKVVRDPIHGNIRFSGIFLEFLECPEIQRLHNIKQLGFAYMVFPGANHTRLEHSIGAYEMAHRAGESLSLPDDERFLIECSALLHDIGHGPFSHTLESILRERFGVDHVDITEKMLLGKEGIINDEEREFVDAKTVVEIIEEYGINPKDIVSIIRGKESSYKTYLSQLLNSPIDVDQLDYLLRDGYYTGVAYGTVDVDRFLHTLTIYNDRLAIERKGVNVVENILIARELMYSSVYFHKTVRIAELMLSKAMELLDEESFQFYLLTDGEMFSELKKKGDFQREIVTRLKYRRLFKQAYFVSSVESEKIGDLSYLEDPNERSEKEREFEERLGIPKGHIIIDVPKRELFLSEPRIDKVDIPVIEGDRLIELSRLTPIATAIKNKRIPDWYLMVVTDEKYKEEVAKSAEKILFA